MFISQNEIELQAYGQQLATHLKAGDILFLRGDLGAGKTTFTKGLARGLGITQMVKSPTYTIVRTYEGEIPLYHLDVYRIGNDPESIDLDEFLYGDGVCVIEWGELLRDKPSDYLEIHIEPHADGRCLSAQGYGQRGLEIVEAWQND